ncbi:MAG: non-ribosomal peptide synthetase, partial [Flavitalea sp.]
SFSQERLWFIDRLEGSLQYHMYSVLRLQGTLNKEALQYALQEIVSRHEVLRTVFTENDGHVLQNIIGKDGWKLSTTDGSKYSADSKALKKSIEKIISQPFDLASDYMLRANLVTINNKENVLVVTMHHIASDGWSLGVIVREVSELYNAYNDNREAQLKPLTLQYADFAIWQRRYLHGEILATKMNYWKRKLQDAVVLQLPTDYPRPQIQSTRGALKTFSVDKEISESIQKFSQNNGCTVFMTLLAAFKVLLHRYSGQEDICVGTPIAGRQQQDVEELIGFFVNTLALRTEVKGNYTFLEHLQHIKTTTLEAYENQEVPFEKVVDAVVRERDMSRTPLFQVMLVLQNNAEIPTVQLGDVTLSADNYQHTSAMFDMTFFMIETPAGLKGRVEYCIDLYSEQTIVQLITHFKELLCSGVKFPERKIGSLPMITEADEFQLLYDFNKTTQLSLQDKTIVDLFEEQVERTPGAVAVIFDNIQLTYRQLNERANQLARYLLQKGVRQESLVPICVERSHEMIVGILGILKAGGAYVPIDPGYPDERIAYMLDDTKAAMLVTSRHSTSKIPGLNNFDRIELDSDWSLIEEQPKNNLDTFIGQTQLAYIIYTSGSTGKPKGVMIEHASVYTFISWCQREFASSQFDIVYAGTSMCFDLSIYEIFYPLSIGKKLRVIENGLHIAKYLPADSSVLTNSVPSVILSLLKEGADLRNISVMNMAGEPIPVQVQENLDADKIEIRNLYGPTEDTTYSTIFRLKNNSPVLIGK